MTDNSPIRTYVNKTEDKIVFKIKTGHYLAILTPETMKSIESTKSKINKDENGENVSHLEDVEIVLVLCNISNNDYQQGSKLLYTLVPNKSYSLKNFIFLRTFNSEFPYIEVWFTAQNSKMLEIEDKINITLVIN